MILEIRLSNFYSIKEEIVLDLAAGNINTKKTEDLKNNVFSFNDTKVLKSLALYGANASGKSNIIKSIQFCVMMITNSHNHNENVVFNFKPFKFDGFDKTPSSFKIYFVIDSVEYEYSFSLNQSEILSEELYYYPKSRKAMIFTRDESLGKEKKEIYFFPSPSIINKPFDIADSTSKKTLFISRASQMDRDIAKVIFRFFGEKFTLGYRGFNYIESKNLFYDNKQKVLKALGIADSDIVDISIKNELRLGKNYKFNLSDGTTSIEEGQQNHQTITTFHRANPAIEFDLNFEESSGTQVLFHILLTILDVVKHNKILLIDEIEMSLHTKIVEYIIELFHTSSSAQLIYTTHNTNLLNLNKLRKDQIYFVNKKEDASTDLYSLFDYKDFRDNMDVEKAYLQGRFDAIPYIDDSRDNLKSLIDE